MPDFRGNLGPKPTLGSGRAGAGRIQVKLKLQSFTGSAALDHHQVLVMSIDELPEEQNAN